MVRSVLLDSRALPPGQVEMYEKIIASKDEEIVRQQKIIEGLLAKR